MLAYLFRYTHRVGITNRRLLAVNRENQTLTFGYKDYADNSRRKSMTVSLSEFIRRFRPHILPERFVKIRHYGLVANRNRHSRIARALAALSDCQIRTFKHRTTVSQSRLPLLCPHCHQPDLMLLRVTRPPGIKSRFDDSS